MRLNRSGIPPVYAITDIPADGNYSRLVLRLAAAGLRWIQIRVKGESDGRFYEEVRRAVLDSPDVTIIVNDRADIAVATEAHGVHLGDGDLPPGLARTVAARNDFIIGCSTHDPSEAIRVAALDEVDYVAIGPIFRSPTKNVREPLGLDALREIRERIAKPIVAIGGIDVFNAAAVLRAGADSVAVVSALDQGGDITAAASGLFAAVENAR